MEPDRRFFPADVSPTVLHAPATLTLVLTVFSLSSLINTFSIHPFRSQLKPSRCSFFCTSTFQPVKSSISTPTRPPLIWLLRWGALSQCPLWQFFSTPQRPVVELGSTTESHLPTVITRLSVLIKPLCLLCWMRPFFFVFFKRSRGITQSHRSAAREGPGVFTHEAQAYFRQPDRYYLAA